MDLGALKDAESSGLRQTGGECEGDKVGMLVWILPEADPEVRIQVQIVHF